MSRGEKMNKLFDTFENVLAISMAILLLISFIWLIGEQ